MKVHELIALLQEAPPEFEMVLCDPDTGWTLPLLWGDGYPVPQRGNPPNVVFVTASYSDGNVYRS